MLLTLTFLILSHSLCGPDVNKYHMLKPISRTQHTSMSAGAAIWMKMFIDKTHIVAIQTNQMC